MDPAHLPVDQAVGFLGKGLQGGFLGPEEPFPAGDPESGVRTVIDPGDQDRESLVDLGKASEAAVPEAPADVSLKNADRALNERFVPGTPRPSRHHGRSVMNGQVQIGGVQIRIVEVGLQDPRLGVVRNGDPAHPAKKRIHLLMGQEPAGPFLVDGRKSKQKLAVTENPDEDLGLQGAVPIVPPHDRIAGIIDFAMAPGLKLPEGDCLLEKRSKAPVQVLPEVRVAGPFGRPFFPDQFEFMAVPDLPVHRLPVHPVRPKRLGDSDCPQNGRRLVPQPTDLGHPASPERQGPGDLPIGQSFLNQTQYLVNPYHRQSFPGHRASFFVKGNQRRHDYD